MQRCRWKGGSEAVYEYLRPRSASQARDRQGAEPGWAGGGGSRGWASGRSRCGESWSLPG